MDELLAEYTDLPITKVETTTTIEPGHIYLMSSQQNLIVQGGMLTPVDNHQQHHVNLPIDLFFHSLGNDQKGCCIGIVLSGTGTDGSRGIKTIRERGGIVAVQDPDEASFAGMPNAALQSGVVDYTLPVERIAAEVNRIVDGNNAPQVPEHAQALLTSEEGHLKEAPSSLTTTTPVANMVEKAIPDTLLQERLGQLKKELQAKDNALRHLHEQLETSYEELQASNKELMSSNEELQRSNKELQSMNEELHMVIIEKEQAQEQIRITAERLKMVLVSSKTGIWEWNLQENTVEANEQWRIIFDIADPGAIDVQQVLNRIHPDDRPRIDQAIQQSMDDDRFYDEDFRIIKDNRDVFFVNGQGNVIRDPQGRPIKMLGTNVDITDQKHREEQLRLNEERLTMALSGTSDGVYDYYNLETGESWWSPRLYELLGYASDDVVANAHHFRQWIYPKDQGLTQKAVQEYINTGRPFDVEFRVKHRTLGYRWFRSRANIVLNDQGQVIRMVGAFADIHQRKIGELNLQQANRKLRVANEYLDNFVFMAAHDLRSPVANLKSLADLWRSGYDNHELIIDKVEKSVVRLDDTLSGLIQILDIQQYEHKQVSALEFDRMYRKLLAEMGSLVQLAQASLRTDFAEPGIQYIEPFLESTMRNLLSNALTYRSPARPVEITLSTYRNNGFVVFQVQDNGMGIDLHRGRDKLFKAFERLTQEGEGKGIGMHLIKNMVEKNQGFIEVESEPGRGTTFKVYLKPYQ